MMPEWMMNLSEAQLIWIFFGVPVIIVILIDRGSRDDHDNFDGMFGGDL